MKLIVENVDGNFNVKKLMWRLGYTLKYLEEATGLPYRKLQRLFIGNNLDNYKLIDVLKICSAMGYESVDKFLHDAMYANQYFRTVKMEEILERAMDNQIKHGTMLKKDLEDLLVEASYSNKVRVAPKEKKDDLINECIKMQQPDDLMKKHKLDMLISPEKHVVYLRKPDNET